MYLKGKTAVITGISKGLGKALTLQLLDRGVTVIGWGLTAPDYAHERLHFISCDVSDEAQVAAALARALEISASIDFLVNNAGFGRFAPIEDIEASMWRRMLEVNLTGAFLVAKAVVPSMKTQSAGHIINISSIAGRQGMAQGEGYNASKFGLRGLSEALFFELRNFGIKVSTVYPGSISTAFFDEIPAIDIHDRMMRAEDVAGTVVHLLDSHPNYVIREVEMRPLIPRPPKE